MVRPNRPVDLLHVPAACLLMKPVNILGDHALQPAGDEDRHMGAVRQHFTPEFLGRLDKIVPFRPLQPQIMESIAAKYLQQLQQRALDAGIQLQLPQTLAAELGSACQKAGGARQLRRLVQERVEGPLAACLLRIGKKHPKVYGQIRDGKLQFRE